MARAQAASALYLDPRAPAAARAHDLIGRMTLEEKASQLINHAVAIPRLEVPEYDWWSEALHGVIALNAPATVFPEPIGMAASFDPGLAHEVAAAVAEEGRVNYARAVRAGRHGFFEGLTFYAPNINIFRDPRWGRGQETYGEAPYLTSRFAVAYITGLQGDDPDHLQVAATAKHFAAYSGPEPLRHRFDATVSRHDEEDTYFPAFEAAVRDARVVSVMCSYNAVNGAPACANLFMLQSVLRGAWGFQGFVASDCDAVRDIRHPHDFAATPVEAAAKAIRAGLDAECLDEFAPQPEPAPKKYVDAVRSGLLSEADLDRALERSFAVRFRLGLFDPTPAGAATGPADGPLGGEAHRLLARRMADESMVLLKNDGLLPLARTVRSIAVVGALAADEDVLLGNYNGHPEHAVTVLEGLRQAFPGARIVYEPGAYFPTDPADAVPSEVLSTPDGQTGLKAEFFASPDLTGAPALTRTDAGIAFSGKAAPIPGVGARGSVRWTGWLTPAETGTYRVGVKGTNNRLLLDGRLVVDDTLPHAPDTKTAEVSLEKGRRYAIELDVLPGFAEEATLLWSIVRPDVRERAVAAARQADVVVAVVGITSKLEGEESALDLPGFKGGDRTSLDLPVEEQALLEAVKATGKPMAVVLMNGSALGVTWAQAHADAILEAWYPGEEGGAAVGATLAGTNNPAGRLPVTFYTGVEQLPAFEDYAMAGRTYRYFTGAPLYRFGHGLSYARSAYGAVKLSAGSIVAGQPLTVRGEVRNTSDRDGEEVAQLYVSFPGLPGAPIRALRGFERIRLAPGERRTVAFRLEAKDLSYVTLEGVRKVGAGDYRLSLGGGQPGDGAAGAEAGLRITGSALVEALP